jgi:hypothetical protein
MSGWKTTAASLGAMVASLLTLGCCLPLPFLGAARLAWASIFLSVGRPWLLGLSVVLLGVGFFQAYRGMKCRARQNRIALVLLGLAHGRAVALPADDSGRICDAGRISAGCQPQPASTLEPHLVHGVVQRCARRHHGRTVSNEPRAHRTPSSPRHSTFSALRISA